MTWRVEESRKSECFTVMVKIEVVNCSETAGLRFWRINFGIHQEPEFEEFSLITKDIEFFDKKASDRKES